MPVGGIIVAPREETVAQPDEVVHIDGRKLVEAIRGSMLVLHVVRRFTRGRDEERDSLCCWAAAPQRVEK